MYIYIYIPVCRFFAEVLERTAETCGSQKGHPEKCPFPPLHIAINNHNDAITITTITTITTSTTIVNDTTITIITIVIIITGPLPGVVAQGSSGKLRRFVETTKPSQKKEIRQITIIIVILTIHILLLIIPIIISILILVINKHIMIIITG